MNFNIRSSSDINSNGISFYTKGLVSVKAGTASVLASIEPVVATLIGVFIYHEILKWDVALGIVMILSSTLIMSLGNNTSKSK